LSMTISISLMLLVLGLASTLISDTSLAAKETDHVQIEEGETYQLTLPVMVEDNKYSFDIKVNDGYRPGYVDIYILNSEELYEYNAGRRFLPEYSVENTAQVDFTWERDDSSIYYLVIDNADNVRPNDAVPNGTLKLELEMETSELISEDILEGVRLMVYFGVIVASAILAAVTLFLYFRYSKKRYEVVNKLGMVPERPYGRNSGTPEKEVGEGTVQCIDDKGQGTENKGQGTEDKGQGTEDKGQSTEDKGQGTENKGDTQNAVSSSTMSSNQEIRPLQTEDKKTH